MRIESSHIFTGHDPHAHLEGYDGEGVDLLLTEYADAHGNLTRELAVRPGKNRRDRTWGPPSLLVQEAS